MALRTSSTYTNNGVSAIRTRVLRRICYCLTIRACRIRRACKWVRRAQCAIFLWCTYNAILWLSSPSCSSFRTWKAWELSWPFRSYRAKITSRTRSLWRICSITIKASIAYLASCSLSWMTCTSFCKCTSRTRIFPQLGCIFVSWRTPVTVWAANTRFRSLGTCTKSSFVAGLTVYLTCCCRAGIVWILAIHTFFKRKHWVNRTFAVGNRLTYFRYFIEKFIFIARHTSKLTKGILWSLIFRFEPFVAGKWIIWILRAYLASYTLYACWALAIWVFAWVTRLHWLCGACHPAGWHNKWDMNS